MGRSVYGQVDDIDSSWGRLKSHYEAPEEQRVYDLMDPAVKSARELKGTLGKVAGHLDLYASELRCLKPRLKDLERRAGEFHSKCIDGVPEDPFAYGYSNDVSIEREIIPWHEDPDSLQENEDLLLEYGRLHEDISTAATKCANSINDLVESWTPVDREAVTAEELTNPEQPMPWGSPVEADLGALGDLGQGVLNVPVDAVKDLSPLVLGYNPDSGEDFQLSDLNNWGVRGDALKDSADLYWSTAKVAAAGWTQEGARRLGKEEPAWTRTKDMQERADRVATGWGAVVKYDHQAAKAGGDGWHAYKGEDKLETWAEMGTTVLLTVGTGGGAAAVKGGTKSLGAGRAAKAGSDAPDVGAPKSLLDSVAKGTNPLRGIDEAVGDLGTSYPSGHGPGKATNSLLGAVDDAPTAQKSPDAPVSNSINTEPSPSSSPGAPDGQPSSGVPESSGAGRAQGAEPGPPVGRDGVAEPGSGTTPDRSGVGDGADGKTGPDGAPVGPVPDDVKSDVSGSGSGADGPDSGGPAGASPDKGGSDRAVAWTDDFSEKASHQDSPDAQVAAQAKLNERANRFVDDKGLTEPMDVWDTGKIRATDRGFVVEAANGGNLPGSTSPWDKLEKSPDGRRVATSIKSMDPRLPSYTRGNAVFNTLSRYIDAVDSAKFSARGGVPIHPRHLDARVLEFYVPPDSLSPKQLAQVDRARRYAESKGIDLVVEGWP